MSTTEHPVSDPVQDEEFIEPPEMVAHLYPPPHQRSGKTLCGIAREHDPHRSLHLAHGYKQIFVFGMTFCPSCSAQICASCIALTQQWRV